MGRYRNNKDGTKTLIAGRGNTDSIESQIGYVEATDTAVSAHAVGSYFINKTGQFVKVTKAIAIGDTISVGTGENDNCVATDIAGVLTELNSNIGQAYRSAVTLKSFNAGSSYTIPVDDYYTYIVTVSQRYAKGRAGCWIAFMGDTAHSYQHSVTLYEAGWTFEILSSSSIKLTYTYSGGNFNGDISWIKL